MVAWLAEHDAANTTAHPTTAEEEHAGLRCQPARPSVAQPGGNAASDNTHAETTWVDRIIKTCHTNSSAAVWIAGGQVSLTYRQWLTFAAKVTPSAFDPRSPALAFGPPWFKPFVDTFARWCLYQPCFSTDAFDGDDKGREAPPNQGCTLHPSGNIANPQLALKCKLQAYCADANHAGDVFAGALLLRAAPELLPILAK
jgi:hypothetical protein